MVEVNDDEVHPVSGDSAKKEPILAHSLAS